MTPVICLPLRLTSCGNVDTGDVIGMAALTDGEDGSPVLLV